MLQMFDLLQNTVRHFTTTSKTDERSRIEKVTAAMSEDLCKADVTLSETNKQTFITLSQKKTSLKTIFQFSLWFFGLENFLKSKVTSLKNVVGYFAKSSKRYNLLQNLSFSHDRMTTKAN